MDRPPRSSRIAVLAACTLLAVAGAWAMDAWPRRRPQGGTLQHRVPAPRSARVRILATRPVTAAPSAALSNTSPPPRSTCGVDIAPAELPAGVARVAGIAYGSDRLQSFDVYYPTATSSTPRPVLVMVHGGGWREGDKLMDNVWRNKVAWWVPRGWIVVSVDYRLLPDTAPLEQAGDVASAIARAQQLAPLWNGDPSRFVLMGHSAGAHLVALLDADVTLAATRGAQPWRAAVALDSAAYDVPRIMHGPHLPLYDDAFGLDPAQWPVASPVDRLHAGGAPLLAICSSQRTESCPQARDFAVAAQSVGTAVSVIPEDLTHEAINETLGLPGSYTDTVDRFVRDAVR